MLVGSYLFSKVVVFSEAISKQFINVLLVIFKKVNNIGFKEKLSKEKKNKMRLRLGGYLLRLAPIHSRSVLVYMYTYILSISTWALNKFKTVQFAPLITNCLQNQQ